MKSAARVSQSPFCKHLLSGALVVLPLLAGCALGTPAGREAVPSDSAYGGAVQGTIHGGQQPVTGSHIYLFETGIATGTTTTSYTTQPIYAAKPVSLLTASSGTVANPSVVDADGNYYVTTDASGNFSINPTSYTCGAGDSSTPSIPRQIYFLAIGGNPGASGNNPEISMMAAYGDCTGYAGNPGPSTTGINSSTIVNINELTTVAAATALQQFANFATGNTVTPVGFSTSSTNTAGLRRAILAANNLVNISTGTVYTVTPTTGSAGTVPWRLLTDLGNVIAGCVNSVPSPSSTYCATLSTETGAPSITDTLTDALEIALNPSLGSTAKVATMWGNIPPSSAFGTQLSAAPNDWSLAIDWSPSSPTNFGGAIAIDANGNVWTAGYSTAALNEFDNAGNVETLPTFSGYSLQRNMAFDLNGSLWITGRDTVTYDAGAREATKAVPGNFDVTIDPSGNAWVDGYNAAGPYTALAELSSSLGSTSFSSYNVLQNVNGLATTMRDGTFDQNGYLWIGNSDSPGTVGIYTVADVTNNSTATPLNSTSPYNYAVNSGTATGYNEGPFWIAFDANNNAFVSVTGGYEQMSPANTAGGPAPIAACLSTMSGTTLRGACGDSDLGTNPNIYLAIDGTGNVWVTAYQSGATLVPGSSPATYTTTSNIQKFAGASATNPGTALSGTGLKSDQQELDKPYQIAIDGSGNIWVISIGGTIHSSGSLVEFVGLASPVITPIASALHQKKLATCP